MIVKYQKEIELVNLCGALYDETEVVDALLHLANLTGRPIQRVKRVFMYGNYPGVSIHGAKVHLHRLLGIYWWRESDALFDIKYVHHKNHDKMDARKSNLEILSVEEHQRYHNKGKVFTPEHRAKIGEGNRNRWRKLRPELYENPELLK